MMLDNQVAIVTGGSQGLGKEISFQFAEEGADVVLAARSEDKIQENADEINESDEYPGSAMAVATDVSDEDAVENLVDETLDEYGTVDILVNNAAIGGPSKYIENLASEKWRQILDINLTGAYYCTKKVVPILKEKEDGRIINISSTGGKKPYPLRCAYATTKTGIIGFGRSIADELGQWNINVNTVCPGPIKSPRIDRMIENRAEERDISFEKAKKAYTKGSMFRRFVTNEEVANMVVFLASEKGKGVTGQDINVSVGMYSD
ncbi:MAG: SDR family NAD(P)-dependent oxidoreductase [Halobacteria archaeon]|nr:SDR family NAD(P)-dependent oxidoreductase [Halobacteria archaeon]